LGNTINGTSNNGTFGINHLSEESKKRKKSQEDEKENEGVGP